MVACHWAGRPSYDFCDFHEVKKLSEVSVEMLGVRGVVECGLKGDIRRKGCLGGDRGRGLRGDTRSEGLVSGEVEGKCKFRMFFL